MSNSRHGEPDVRGYSVTHPRGHATLPIEPGWHQLVYAAAGVMTVATPAGRWSIPPHRALWIPDGAAPTIINHSRLAVRTLYFSSVLPGMTDRPRAITVSTLVRELLLYAVKTCPLRLDRPAEAALVTLLLDRLNALPAAPLLLPMPKDTRAAELILADPTKTLATIAAEFGASRRTLERAFAAETGLTLGGWHRRARILLSLETLTTRGSVTAAAMAAGYSTPSAYVVAFKSELGQTPRQFVGETPPPNRVRA